MHKGRFALRIGAALGVVVLLVLFWRLAPLPLFEDPYSRVLLDREGALIGAVVATDDQWRFPPAEAIPHKLARALVTFEDKRFYGHPGVDPQAAMRALLQNIRAGRIVSGGSTITMQVIRLSQERGPRSLLTKIREAAKALRLELRLGKQAILALYAGHAPFGGNVVGLQAAAWRYFGRSPEDLSWAEAAMLAVLPNSPSLVHPGRNRERLRSKRDRLLDRLRENGDIDDLTCSLAKSEPLPPRPFPIPMIAPHLLFRTAKETPSDRSAVRTTIHRHLQVRATRILRRHSEQLSGNRIHNAAALVLDVPSGDVLAYVGNVPDLTSAKHDNYVDCVTAPRSTGSILKPLLYAGMHEAGELLPGSLIADIPTRMGGFRPQNYSRTYQGAVPAFMGLARSLNIPAARMLRDYGVERFYSLLQQLGMTMLHRPAADYGITLILGGAEGSLWDITGIYAGLARTAMAKEPNTRSYFPPHYRQDKEQGDQPFNPATRPLGSPACWLALEAMLQVTRPGVDSSWQSFASAPHIAWKTGTSYGFRDAWAVGVSPKYAVGVWVGNADGEGRPELIGITAAAPLMFELFSALGDSGGWFDMPTDGLIDIPVCAHSGYRAGRHCPRTRSIQATQKSLHTPSCAYCRPVHIDKSGRFQVHADCEDLGSMRTEKRFILPPVMEWYYRQHHSDYKGLPAWRADCGPEAGEAGGRFLSLVYPTPSGRIYIPREIDGRRGRSVFEAAHRRQDARLFWHIDDAYIGETQGIHQVSVAPLPGVHRLTVVDDRGEEAVRQFTVLSAKAKESRQE